MRSHLVLVHGIGPVRRVHQEIEDWTNALIEGAHYSGHSTLARGLAASVDTVFAHYADLFFLRGAQGQAGLLPGGLGDEETLVLSQIVAEIIDTQMARSNPEDVVLTLQRARAQLYPSGQPQGLWNVLRHVINATTTLLDVPGIRRGGQWVTGIELAGNLAQVGRYLGRRGTDNSGKTLDHQIRERLLGALDNRPSIIIAHSLGTVVTLETLAKYQHPVPLLVTLGSPLCMRTVVRPRVRPRPLTVPQCVHRWLNFWDRDDILAVRPLLESDFLPSTRGVLPGSRRVDSDGLWVHTATKYLAQPAVAGPVAEALMDSRSV